jgi:ATP-dependent DNA ligase
MIDTKLYLQTRPSFSEYHDQVVRWVEIKEDGWRLSIIKRDGRVSAFSKKPNVDLWPKVQRNETIARAVMSLPDDTIVEGEAHVPGGLSSDVPTALTTGEGWKLSAFALPHLGGLDMRKESLFDVRGHIKDLGFDLTHCVPYQEVYGGCDRDFFKADAAERGIEGYVLKLQHWLGWYRVKPKKTVDVIVHGQYEGNNRLVGSLGGYIVGLLDEHGTWMEVGRCGGGFSDIQRDELWARPAPIGRVCEVEYDSITSGGRLRFPQFIRWRDDKEATSCRMSQLTE